MTEQKMIRIDTLCRHYKIELSFLDELSDIGLVRIEVFEDNRFIHQDDLRDLEKMIRLSRELNVNIEGIDVVFNLLEKESALRNELIVLKNRLQLYEIDK